jgi:hypothetical protein
MILNWRFVIRAYLVVEELRCFSCLCDIWKEESACMSSRIWWDLTLEQNKNQGRFS